ncbi:MAG: thymidine phosphorylase [Clostridia bacterium]|nr:thymidine phosphorylase [Clostridia bacterium]
MRMYDIIKKKRDGYALCEAEIREFIKGYVAGEIPDYQVSALLMAIFFRGMTDEETAILTDAMARSGDTVDLSCFGDLSVDKHSTGGVGDKTTLVITPVLASLGAKVAKMTGRGLGHTGGTADKLESIEGFCTSLSGDRFISQTEEIGIAVTAQGGNLTPADKMLYALRDVTATVDSIPLITSSIMSKKLAAGAKNIVLDVKMGSGAFMKSEADAETLARKMVDIGKRCGRNVSALITNMDRPLGSAVGNSLEVIEAAGVLRGEVKGDLYEICVALATEMAALSLSLSPDEAKRQVVDAIESKAAFEKMKQWISAQGGNADWLSDVSLFPKAAYSREIKADRGGFITKMDAEMIGTAVVILGGGRLKKDDGIDHSAGIMLYAKTGDRIEEGDILCTLYTCNEQSLSAAADKYREAIKIGDEKPDIIPQVVKILR